MAISTNKGVLINGKWIRRRKGEMDKELVERRKITEKMTGKYGTFKECPKCGERMSPEGTWFGEHSWECKCGEKIIVEKV